MTPKGPGTTAILIAMAIVGSPHSSKLSKLVDSEQKEWAEAFLKQIGKTGRFLAFLAKSKAFMLLMSVLERVVLPEIRAHWFSRKKWFEAKAQAQINQGISRIVILGPGMDSLGPRLAQKNPGIEVMEFEHPHIWKFRKRLQDRFPKNCTLEKADLCTQSGLEKVLAASDEKPTLVLAEGVLMYIDKEQVIKLMERSSQKSIWLYSAMLGAEKPAFRQQGLFVSKLLRSTKEKFRWGENPTRPVCTSLQFLETATYKESGEVWHLAKKIS